MAIPFVKQGTVEFAGKIFQIDSDRGATWLESVTSFRFEPAGANKPYTVRKESGKGGDYWYGYRKVVGKLHKKYIGKSSELSTAKLEEIAEALNTPPPPRITDKVTQVTDRSERVVTDRVTDTRADDRLTALELQVRLMQEALEALRSELSGKSDAGNFEELPIVTDSELQIKVGNLQAENEKLKADYAALLQSSTAVTTKLREEVRELGSQLATERADREELEGELADRDAVIAQLRSELADLKQNSATASQDLPDLTEKAGELLSFFKSLLPKNTKLPNGTISKIEKILEG